MKQVYSPGCALMIYKPHLAEKLFSFLRDAQNDILQHLICCHHEPGLENGTRVINTCAGCDRRYRELYEGISTVSLWEILLTLPFPFPDYKNMKMSIHDACPTRNEERVHSAVRKLLEKMNISVVEPENTRTRAVCCGDSFYGILPVEKVKEQMRKRAEEMPPVEDVVVYCVSCVKAMHIGGKKPRYIVDLLFNEKTSPGTFEPDAWHGELREFVSSH